MIGDELPSSRKHRGAELARRAEAQARRYVTEILAGMVPSDPEFEKVYDVHDLVTSGNITWETAAQQVRAIRKARRTQK